MKLLKQASMLMILLLVTACHGNLSDDGLLPEKEYAFSDKSLPDMYRIAPIADAAIQAEAAILVHAITGDVLFGKNTEDSLPVASMSKIMSELLVLEAIEAGEFGWEDQVEISDYAYTISSQPGYASVHLQQHASYPVRDLFKAMAISSANGATIALAEKVSGSEKAFVKLMNERAQQLGMHDSDFVNSTGLMNEGLKGYHSTGELDDTNRMSAQDLAVLAEYIIGRYPELMEMTTLKEFEFQNQLFTNSNWMLPGTKIDFIDADVTYTGVDGLKTGFTDEAGYGFTGTAEIGERRFISVVIGTEAIEDRFLETKRLYEMLQQQLGAAE